MHNKGKFIVFEGLDGAGKGTQLELFRQFLNEQHSQGESSQLKIFKENLNSVYNTKNLQFDLFSMFLKDEALPYATYDFPRYYDNYWGSMVGRMLSKEFGTEINPYLRSLPYLLDQAAAAKQIRKELRAGKVIISNRYISSSMIFQTALITDKKGKDEYVKWLEITGYKELGMVRPDCVLALYVDPEVAQELITKKTERKYTQGKVKDLNEENLELQKNAAKEMLNFCKTRKDWKLINCMDGKKIKTPQEISLMIKQALKDYIY